MSRYAVIEKTTGKVTNVIEWNGTAAWTPPTGHVVRQSDIAGPGDTWDGSRFVRPVLTPATDERAVFEAATVTDKLKMLAQRVGLA